MLLHGCKKVAWVLRTDLNIFDNLNGSDWLASVSSFLASASVSNCWLLVKYGSAHFDNRWDLGIDVVVGKMKACSEGALVQQWILVKLDLATGIALVQAHGAVSKIDHFP